jgi:LysR family glycine cleavage system transcriptional activator
VRRNIAIREQLFPVVRDGFGSFVEAINVVRAGGTATRLRLTTTNAFAARWLVPRLPQWRKAHPRLKLEIVSTDEVLSLKNGEADISIRYVRSTPADGLSVELTRDRFHVVAAPKLVGKSRKLLTQSSSRDFR